MVLFVGKEFDADERAEVGGGLRGFEGNEHAGPVGGCGFAVTLREDRLKESVGIGERGP
jgi:hypothetical protein